MQPWTDRIPHPDNPCLLDQDEKRGLKGILGLVPVREHASANAKHHRPMPFDQDRKGKLGTLAPVRRESLQKLAVGQVPDRSHVVQRVNLPENRAVYCVGHDRDPPSAVLLAGS